MSWLGVSGYDRHICAKQRKKERREENGESNAFRFVGHRDFAANRIASLSCDEKEKKKILENCDEEKR